MTVTVANPGKHPQKNSPLLTAQQTCFQAKKLLKACSTHRAVSSVTARGGSA